MKIVYTVCKLSLIFWEKAKMNQDRLKKLLYNALVWFEGECSDFFCNEVGNEYEWFETNIGITESEMFELEIDWLSRGKEDEESNEN